MHQEVTVYPNLPLDLPQHAMREQSSESKTLEALRLSAAAVLNEQARDIAERWEARARSVALRSADDSIGAESPSRAVALIESLSAVLASGGAVANDMVSTGIAYGTESFQCGMSLHHVLKGLDLLNAMALYAVETAVADQLASEPSAADGIRLCRWFQQGSSLLTLVVVKGYTEAANSELRDRFRHLRHDLRNPLGTIKSVLALMDDESIPADERSNPRFRAMAKRNVRSLGDLIGERLSDSEAGSPAFALQPVSLRTIACTVRRDLRAEATARNTVVLIAGTKVRVQIDAAGLELVLRELLVASLQESVEGDELNVSFGEPENGRATVSVCRTPERPAVSERGAIERLGTLAAQMGARLEAGTHLVLSFPTQRQDPLVQPIEESSRVPVEADANRPSRSVVGDARHDLRSTRERENGQAGAL